MHRFSIAILGLALLAPASAHATPNFPDVIEQTVATMGPPPCSLCHQGDVRNNYSVKTPFGAALKARGLVPGDEGSLRTALEALRKDAADSDHDGVGDIDELEAGRDPNVPGDQTPGPRPSYGCFAQIVGPRSSNAAALSVTAVLIAVALMRRRRNRAARHA